MLNITMKHLLFFCGIVYLMFDLSHGLVSNLRYQMDCRGVVNPARYVYYGCWCRPSNVGGNPLDALDDCCKEHNECTRAAQDHHEASFVEIVRAALSYKFQCIENEPQHCSSSELETQICKCDQRFAACVEENQHLYTTDNIVFPFRPNPCV